MSKKKTAATEYLFRGKRVDNGEWIEGYLVKASSRIVDCDCSFIIPLDICSGKSYYGFSDSPKRQYFHGMEMVEPESVGQYTGLKDKNGKKIFEGEEISVEGSWDKVVMSANDVHFCVRRLDDNDLKTQFIEEFQKDKTIIITDSAKPKPDAESDS